MTEHEDPKKTKTPRYIEKDGKRLRFLKSEIDAWLAGGYHKTDDEMQEAAVDYVNQKREGRL